MPTVALLSFPRAALCPEGARYVCSLCAFDSAAQLLASLQGSGLGPLVEVKRFVQSLRIPAGLALALCDWEHPNDLSACSCHL